MVHEVLRSQNENVPCREVIACFELQLCAVMGYTGAEAPGPRQPQRKGRRGELHICRQANETRRAWVTKELMKKGQIDQST
mmetsp:Transcript_29533/g.90533  ORF Transcript_29533/g.90533 Transcript_29533/m.90533 type:complete len:81 (+) Transcript_29533:1219-1461(+)|eukprot:scaffold65299_cov33-Tisochrysis_lutea.AAC.4